MERIPISPKISITMYQLFGLHLTIHSFHVFCFEKVRREILGLGNNLEDVYREQPVKALRCQDGH